jgi:hypothetical protein
MDAFLSGYRTDGQYHSREIANGREPTHSMSAGSEGFPASSVAGDERLEDCAFRSG